MNKSKKRDKIVKIFEKGDLLTAQEIVDKLSDIDRATIYRNLTKLTEAGILREVHVKKGVSSYEIAKPHDYHQHLICTNCEKVIPIDISPSDVKKLIPGVEFDEFELNLRGKCPNCY